jgi:hypothetical protein
LIPVCDPFPALGIVLPLALSPLGACHFTLSLAPVNVVIDIRVPVYVDIHITTMPVGSTPRIPPRCSHSNAYAERKEGCAWRVVRRIHRVGRVGRVCPGTIHHRGVVGRHIDSLRAGRLDHDDLLRLLRLLWRRCPGRRLRAFPGGLSYLVRRVHLDRQLFTALQVARIVGLFAETLYRGHHILLLGKERITQLLRPLKLIVHHL